MANAKSPLVVMGSSPNLIYESFTENGEYEASDYGADGFAGVIVDVPPPTVYWTQADTTVPYLEEMTIPASFSGRGFATFQYATDLKRFSVLAPTVENLQQYRLIDCPNLE